jgi:hypothetical protein
MDNSEPHTIGVQTRFLEQGKARKPETTAATQHVWSIRTKLQV